MRAMSTVAIVAVTFGLAGTAATTLAVENNSEPRPQGCTLETLRGAYGMQWIGTRPIGPGTPPPVEAFTGIAIRTFDGEGTFTQVSNVKGFVLGLEPENIETLGTYTVNEDCSGEATAQFVPNAPIVTARFVIVDGGDEVLQSVMTPIPLFNAGVMKRIRSR